MLEFHQEAKLIARGPIGPPYYLDDTYDALYFVGQHAMAGTLNAPLSHTYSSRSIEYYKINGMPMGEFGCRAAMAGEFNVPTAFISGDDKAVAEARQLISNICCRNETGPWARTRFAPVSQKARESIRKTVAKACRNINQIAPLKIEPPYEQEIRVLEGQSIEGYLRRGAARLDDRTVVKQADTMCELFI